MCRPPPARRWRGRALTRRQDIAAGAVIGSYTGDVCAGFAADDRYGMNFHAVNVRTGAFAADGARLGAGARAGFRVSAAAAGSCVRFVNHCCTPNAAIHNLVWRARRLVVYVALRAIAPFEEITVDYGAEYWERELQCRCAAEQHLRSDGFAAYKKKWDREHPVAKDILPYFA